MNKRCCQYPICFAWKNIENDYAINPKFKSLDINSTIPILQLLAESEFKCVYDRNTTDTAEVYVCCVVLEKVFHLGVNLEATVMDVKNRIKRFEKIPLALMRLFLNGKLLKDHCPLSEYGIKNKSVMMLGIKLHTAFCENCSKEQKTSDDLPKNIMLHSITGPCYTVELPFTSTIENLKETIDEKYGIYPDHQLIVHKGKRLEDDVTMEEYGVNDASELFLIPYQYDNCGFCSGCAKANGKSTITLKFLNIKVDWALYPEQTIRELKDLSYQFLHHIHPDLQLLILKKKELKDSDTLKQCGVRDGAKLKVKLIFHLRKCDKCNGTLV